MAMSDEALAMARESKGSFLGYVAYDNILELWFSSPTGDESDVILLRMPCVSSEQAHEIARMHQQVWGHDEAYAY